MVGQVIEGAYEVLNRFEGVETSREEMKCIPLNEAERRAFAETALDYRYEGQHVPVSAETVVASIS